MIFVKQWRPKKVQEMSVLAEQYPEIHRNTYNFANTDNKPSHIQDSYLKRNDYSNGKCADVQLGSSPESRDLNKARTTHPARKMRKWFLCKKQCHIARDCRIVQKPRCSPSPGNVKAMHPRQVEKRTSAVVIAKPTKHEGDNSGVERGVDIGMLNPELAADMPVVIGKICEYKGNVSVLWDTGCP